MLFIRNQWKRAALIPGNLWLTLGLWHIVRNQKFNAVSHLYFWIPIKSRKQKTSRDKTKEFRKLHLRLLKYFVIPFIPKKLLQKNCTGLFIWHLSNCWASYYEQFSSIVKIKYSNLIGQKRSKIGGSLAS